MSLRPASGVAYICTLALLLCSLCITQAENTEIETWFSQRKDIGSERIPKMVHFVFGMAPDASFGFVYFLAVKSAFEVLKPDVIWVHYSFEPKGEFWNAAKQFVRLNKVKPIKEIFGNPVEHYAHKADVIRMQMLEMYGGIYLDLDVWSLRAVDNLLDQKFVVGKEEDRNNPGSLQGAGNSVFMTRPHSKFVKEWYEAYHQFDQKQWNYHSVILPRKMADRYLREHPSELTLLESEAFLYPLWDIKGVMLMYTSRLYDFQKNYAIHLWNSAAKYFVLQFYSHKYLNHIDLPLHCYIRRQTMTSESLRTYSVEKCIQPRYEPTQAVSSLVGHWGFDEADDGEQLLYDLSPSQLNGWLRGSQPARVPGVVGKAVAFNGRDTELMLLLPRTISTAEMTVSMWIRSPQRDCKIGGHIWSLIFEDLVALTVEMKGSPHNAIPSLRFERGLTVERRELTQAERRSMQIASTEQVNLCDGAWHLLSVTMSYNDNLIALYSDGHLLEHFSWRHSNKIMSFWVGTSLPLDTNAIRKKRSADTFFQGMMDRITVYAKTLSPRRIRRELRLLKHAERAKRENTINEPHIVHEASGSVCFHGGRSTQTCHYDTLPPCASSTRLIAMQMPTNPLQDVSVETDNQILAARVSSVTRVPGLANTWRFHIDMWCFQEGASAIAVKFGSAGPRVDFVKVCPPREEAVHCRVQSDSRRQAISVVDAKQDEGNGVVDKKDMNAEWVQTFRPTKAGFVEKVELLTAGGGSEYTIQIRQPGSSVALGSGTNTIPPGLLKDASTHFSINPPVPVKANEEYHIVLPSSPLFFLIARSGLAKGARFTKNGVSEFAGVWYRVWLRQTFTSEGISKATQEDLARRTQPQVDAIIDDIASQELNTQMPVLFRYKETAASEVGSYDAATSTPSQSETDLNPPGPVKRLLRTTRAVDSPVLLYGFLAVFVYSLAMLWSKKTLRKSRVAVGVILYAVLATLTCCLHLLPVDFDSGHQLISRHHVTRTTSGVLPTTTSDGRSRCFRHDAGFSLLAKPANKQILADLVSLDKLPRTAYYSPYVQQMPPKHYRRMLRQKVKVSIIMPCYGQAHFLQEAVDSIVKQTFRYWELLVIDDESPDLCLDKAMQLQDIYQDSRIHAYRKPNGGLSDARNYGISLAVGEWILCMDADDSVDPKYLEVVTTKMKELPDHSFFYAKQQFFGESEWKWHVPEWSLTHLMRAGTMPVQTVFKFKDWLRTGGFSPCLPWGNEDYSYWLSLGALGLKGWRSEEFLLHYRYKSQSMQREKEQYAEVVPMLHVLHPELYSVEHLLQAHGKIMLFIQPKTRSKLSKILQKFPACGPTHFYVGLWQEQQRNYDFAFVSYRQAHASAAVYDWQPAFRLARLSWLTWQKDQQEHWTNVAVEHLLRAYDNQQARGLPTGPRGNLKDFMTRQIQSLLPSMQ